MLKQRLLDIDEAAAELGLSPHSLRKHRCLDTGPESFIFRGRIMYRPQALAEWAESQIANSLRGGLR